MLRNWFSFLGFKALKSSLAETRIILILKKKSFTRFSHWLSSHYPFRLSSYYWNIPKCHVVLNCMDWVVGPNHKSNNTPTRLCRDTITILSSFTVTILSIYLTSQISQLTVKKFYCHSFLSTTFLYQWYR